MDSRFRPRWEAIRDHLVRATKLDYPHPFRPLFPGRAAAVMILGGIRESDGSLDILITRRTESVETHKGQYALPGGMRDSDSETLEDTALRETEEEMGISGEEIETLGRLPPIWTPSGFEVTPIVGLLRKPLERITIRPNPGEIDFWFWCKLDRLREAGIYTKELRSMTHEGVTREIPIDVYQVDEHRIWGATGAMLRNFILRFEKILSEE